MYVLHNDKTTKINSFSDNFLKKAKFYPLVKDSMYQSMFNFTKPEYVCYFISTFFNIDYTHVYNNIKISNNVLPKSKERERDKTVDFICEIDDVLYIIEMNNQADIKTLKRNMEYLYKVAGTRRERGKEKIKKIILINLNNFCFKGTKEVVEKYVPGRMREDKFSIISEDIEIYQIYLSKIKEVWYNKEKLTKWKQFLLISLEEDSKEIEKIIEREEIFMNYRKMAKRVCVTDDLDFRQESLEADAYYLEMAKEEAEEKGERRGKKEEKKDIARNMLKNNFSINDIHIATGLSEKQISNINF